MDDIPQQRQPEQTHADRLHVSLQLPKLQLKQMLPHAEQLHESRQSFQGSVQRAQIQRQFTPEQPAGRAVAGAMQLHASLQSSQRQQIERVAPQTIIQEPTPPLQSAPQSSVPPAQAVVALPSVIPQQTPPQPLFQAEPRSKQTKGSFLRSFRLRTVFAGLAVFVLLGVLGVFWANSSDQGAITVVSGQSPVTSAVFRTFNDKYMMFNYKGEYLLQKLSASGNDLTNYLLRADTDYQKQIAVSVMSAPNGWQSDSAYLLRESQPDNYSKEDVAVDGVQGVIWTKSDGTEETVMLPHGGEIATLSFTTAMQGGGPNNLDPEVRDLLATFTWQ